MIRRSGWVAIHAVLGSAMKPKDPLHGITLERIVTELVAHYGWPQLGEQVNVRCFTHDPSIKSSLTFLRRTPWARTKVEGLYLFMLRERARAERRASPGDPPPEE